MRPPPPSRREGEELQLQQQQLLLLVQLLSLGDGAPAAAASFGGRVRPLILPSGSGRGVAAERRREESFAKLAASQRPVPPHEDDPVAP